jgi:hypothetical protein
VSNAQDIKERTSNGGGVVRVNMADSITVGHLGIFPDSGGCLPGIHQLGLELHYDRADLAVRNDWGYSVVVALLDTMTTAGTDTLAVDTLTVGSNPEIRTSSLLWDDTVSCNQGYVMDIRYLASTGVPPHAHIRLESHLYRLDLPLFNRTPGFTAWHRSVDSQRELVYWSHQEGAHSYDLEWVFVDEYELEAWFGASSETAREAFGQKGAVRINTPQPYYEVPLHYPGMAGCTSGSGLWACWVGLTGKGSTATGTMVIPMGSSLR